ncbi:hypothetical protein BDE36_4786 [Arcticibacter tournemirensis]|nr:hypothetical protein BDE36_4786 [Arcticibacter tournemirensis]
MRNLFKLLTIAIMLLGLGSCGIFRKKCNCPHFYKFEGLQTPQEKVYL